MATYKVLQDIEAEDKLVGPLTFRQFVYAGIAALNLYLCFLVVTKGAIFMAAVFLPIALLGGFFAWPWSRDQPTEVWALAKIRFLIKPRKRIWSQSGIKELVTINAPKRVERILTKGLTESEVKSRLQALASTIDTRGWAIKNVNLNMAAQTQSDSDRLIGLNSLPRPVEDLTDVRASDDILDVQNNPVAQQFDSMIAASTQARRQQVLNRMQQASTAVAAPAQPKPPQAPAPSYWFLNQPAQPSASVPQDTVTFNTQVVAPGAPVSDLPVMAATPTPDEEAFIKQHDAQPAFSPNMHGHLHVIQPLSAQQPAQGTTQPQVGRSATNPSTAPTPAKPGQPVQSPQVTPQPDAAILDLARNDDLNVATLAREVHKRREPSDDEVVISLH